MTRRNILTLVIGLSLVGASCSYGPQAAKTIGKESAVQPTVVPTTGPTETLDQIDSDTKMLGKDIDSEMDKTDQDVKGASTEAKQY